MLFGIDPVSLSAGYILASLTACPRMGPGSVEVKINYVSSPYITNITSKELTDQEHKRNPDTSAYTDGKWMVGGLTVYNGPKMKYAASFQQVSSPKTGDTCYAVEKLTLEIDYAPTVYIASDYRLLGCRHSQTVAHERRHVDIGRRTLDEYKPYFRRALQAEVDRLGARGPFPAATVAAQRQETLKYLAGSVDKIQQQFIAAFRKRQAEIDTIEMYKRESAMCPGQFPQFDGSVK